MGSSWWGVYQLFQPVDKFPPRDGPRAETREVFGLLLAVDQFKTVACEFPDQRDQCNFGGISLAGVHRFAEKHSSERYAVEAPHQFSISP